MFSVGQLFGSAIAVLLISFIIERFFFKNEEPLERALKTAGSALVVAWIIAGFGYADGRGYAWFAGLNYVPGAVFVFLWFKSRYASSWVDDPDV